MQEHDYFNHSSLNRARHGLSKHEDVETIADPWIALALLFERWNDKTARRLMRQRHESIPSGLFIRVSIFASGYTREEWSADHDFPVTEEVFDELVRQGYVEGTPEWGFTDKNTLRMTKHGIDELVKHLPDQPATEPQP